jgi:uncharacterized protein
MTGPVHRVLTVFTLIGVAAGCAATVTRFYTLSSVGDAGVPESSEARTIAVGPVAIPDYVARPEIVVRESPNQVTLATFHQWAGALDDMVARVLLEDLAAQLPGDRVVAFPQAGAAVFDYRVAVQITRFDVGGDGEAIVSGTWRVWDRAGTRTRLTSSSTSHTASLSKVTYQDRVAALSQAVGELAGDIARSLVRLDAERPR